MEILSAVLKVVPFIISGIQAVEGLFSKGSDKKTAVVGATTSIVDILVSTGVITQATADKFPAAVGELNDALVKFLNTVGVLPTTATSVKS